MTPESINAWFDPFHFVTYLFVILVICICWWQVQWDKVSRTNILVLLQKTKGDGDYYLVPIENNAVEIKNKKSGETRIWGINELSTITVPFPTIGFLPRFLLKQIKLVVLDEDTYEPITNRHKDKRLVTTPLFLGNLINEKVTKALALANEEWLEALKKIGKILNPAHFYIFAGLSLVLTVWNLMLVSKLSEFNITVDELQATVEALKAGLNL